MIEFNKEDLAQNLPDSFRKDSDGNNWKILENERLAVEEHLNDVYDIYNILDLDNAYGKTLDYYGERVGQSRGQATDEQYIAIIKAKIMRNLGNGTFPSVIASLCATFDCNVEEVKIEESEEEPCLVQKVTLPLYILINSNMNLAQVTALVKSLLPICVRLEAIELTGTFEFADGEGDYDETKGFCDVEGGSIGGYLGYDPRDKNEPILPI